jgi:hypothetical protein
MGWCVPPPRGRAATRAVCRRLGLKKIRIFLVRIREFLENDSRPYK